MNRNQVIGKLVAEGLSYKTLSGLNDKQLQTLSSRMLKEQSEKGKVNVSSKNPKSKEITKNLTDAGMNVEITEEGDYKKEGFISFVVPNWSVGTLTGSSDDIDTEKKEMVDNFLSKVERKYGTTKFMVDDELDLGVCDSNDIDQETTECTRLLLQKSDKPIYHGDKNILDKQNIKEWIEGVINKNKSSFATKKSIMEVIKKRITEGGASPAPAPVKTPVKTPTKTPEKTPNKRPSRDPWKRPDDQPNPNPKMKKNKLPRFLTFSELSKMEGIKPSINENKKRRK